MAKRGQALRKARAVKKPAKPAVDLKQENVALKRELARERQRATATTEALAATADVLKAISRSTFDLQTVLDTLVESVTRLCEADHAWLFQREGEAFRWVASFGHEMEVHARLRDYFKSRQVPMDRGSVTGRAALETRVVHVPDVLADPEYTWSEAQKIGGYRAALGAPLVRKGEVVGVIFVAKTAPLPFAAKQIELVTTFADQAVIAIENARLITELHESEERHALVSRAVAEGIYEWEVERNGLWVSSRLIDIFGFYGRELRASDWNALVHPEDFPRYRKALRECFKRLTARLDCEYRVRHSDGQYRWIEDRGIPVRNDAGRAVRMVGAITDISERKATDQALREALEQQTATAEVLQVINSAPGNLAPVFDAVLGKALELCGAAFGILWTYDGGQMHAAALRGVPTAYADFLTQGPHAVGENNAHDRLLRGERIVHIVDAAEDKAYLSGDALRRATVELGGSRTLLAVPLRKDNAFLGDFVIYRPQVKPFSDKQIALLESFAAQAVIAMENARLLGELRERTGDLEESLKYQTATSDVLKVISRSTFDLQLVLDTLIQTVAELYETSTAAVAIRDGDVYRYVATARCSPEFDQVLRSKILVPGRDSIVSRVLLERKVVHIDDAETEPGYDFPDAINVGRIRTLLGVPMFREDEVVGVIGLSRQRVEPFTERQIELLRTFAAQAVIAMENARLLGELRVRTGDLEKSLEYQTATSDVLQVISRSTFDLQPVLEMLIKTAARLCRAEMALVHRREGEVYRMAASYGFAAEFESFLRSKSLAADRGTMVGRVALDGKVVHVADCAADPEYRLREAITLARQRTALGVPLLREGQLIGVIVLARERVEPFTERQIELVRTFADQAVIAIENTRLLTEQREALEQQTATAEVLQVINSSPGDLAPVFDAMLEKAMRLCEGAFGGLCTFDDDRYVAQAFRGVPPAYAQFMSGATLIPGPGTAPYRFLKGERSVIQNLDLMDEEPYRADDPQRRALVDLGGARTAMHAPLCKDDAVIGVMTIYRQEVRPFTEKQIALLESFAAQAVIAIENARLITETREALERQTATAEVLQVINESPGNLAPVLEAMLEKALALCNAGFGQLVTFDGARFRAAAWRGYEPGSEATKPTPGMALYHLIEGEQIVHIADITADEVYRSGNAVRRRLADEYGARTAIWVALRKETALLGAFVIYRTEVRPFSDKQIVLLQSFAAQAVIAMENARLLGELRQRTTELARSVDELTATGDVLKIISRSSVDLETVLDTLVETVTRLCRADHAVMFRRRDDTYHMVASHGVSREAKEFFLTHPIPPGRGATIGRVELERRVVQITDVLQDPDYTYTGAHELTGARTMLGIPLLRQDTLVGIFAVVRTRVDPFTTKEIELASSFADQAVIAIENARLFDELRDRQAELRVTFDNMGDGVAMFDAAPRLVAWNRNFQEILGLPDAFLFERPSYADYFRYLAGRGEYSADLEAELARAIADTARQRRFERTRPDGRVIEVRRNPVPGGGFVLIYADITERKRAEETIRKARDAAETALRELQAAQASLLHAQKMAALGQLTAGIAHEIKNPLNFVNNFAGLSVELLGELKEATAQAMGALDADKRVEIVETIGMLTGNLEKIAEHGRRADGIVKSMLAHSRGGSGERQPTDLNVLVEEALNLAYHGARAQDQSFNITLERDFDRNLVPIEVVPQDVTRVFLNLIGNGFYAASKRGRNGDGSFRPVLKVATCEAGEAVEIRVRDNGVGIPPEYRERLFQPFFTTKPTGEGTGLGLSISYEIVTQQHGGTITVDSEVGQFTEFTVRLPRRQHPTAGRAT